LVEGEVVLLYLLRLAVPLRRPPDRSEEPRPSIDRELLRLWWGKRGRPLRSGPPAVRP